MRAVKWAFALIGLGLAAGVSAQVAFGPSSEPPAAHPFTLGKLKLVALHDAQFTVPNDGKTFGVDASTAAVADVLRAAAAPTDRVTLSVNALLVHDGKRVLLIDSGLGPNAHGGLLGSLHEVGVAPKAVTDILITHSHGDHIGGVLDVDGHLAFPKATIRMTGAEWAFAQKSSPPELVKAISGHVKTFEPGARISPSITSVALDGHTPGHTGYEIVSGSARLLDVGDLVHSSIVSLAKPQWTMSFDNASTLAKSTRASTLARLAKDQEWVFSPHFPYPGVGQIAADGSAFSWKAGTP